VNSVAEAPARLAGFYFDVVRFGRSLWRCRGLVAIWTGAGRIKMAPMILRAQVKICLEDARE